MTTTRKPVGKLIEKQFKDAMEKRRKPKKFYLRLPLIPSVNAIYLPRSGGGSYLSKEARAWKEEAVLRLKIARISHFPPKTFVVMEVKGIYPDKRRRDLNNMAKLGCDVLMDAGIIDDDNVLEWREKGWRLVSDVGDEIEDPAVEVWIYQDPDPPMTWSEAKGLKKNPAAAKGSIWVGGKRYKLGNAKVKGMF